MEAIIIVNILSQKFFKMQPRTVVTVTFVRGSFFSQIMPLFLTGLMKQLKF